MSRFYQSIRDYILQHVGTGRPFYFEVPIICKASPHTEPIEVYAIMLEAGVLLYKPTANRVTWLPLSLVNHIEEQMVLSTIYQRILYKKVKSYPTYIRLQSKMNEPGFEIIPKNESQARELTLVDQY